MLVVAALAALASALPLVRALAYMQAPELTLRRGEEQRGMASPQRDWFQRLPAGWVVTLWICTCGAQNMSEACLFRRHGLKPLSVLFQQRLHAWSLALPCTGEI